MRLIDERNAEAYLRETSRIAPDQRVRVCELAGGVSNMVLLVERLDPPADEFVVKQARPQLRTRQEWFSNVERNWREADVLRICAELLENRATAASPRGVSPGATGVSPVPDARTPRILFEDRENYLLAMTAAPRPNAVWKAELLADRVDPRIAAACGTLLGTLHATSWLDNDIRERIGDRTLFEQLRIDPYYRTLAAVRPETRVAVDRVIASHEAHPRCLVHADFSPKNLLIFSGGMLMVDFETGHYGDPAFDLGFFLSHLVLKACLKIPKHAAYLELTEIFRRSYDEMLAAKIPFAELSSLWARGVQNFALCAWARLDGKSPVEYLSEGKRRELVRGLCREILASQPRTWPEVVELA
ncbi:MAG: aminoglycoside phosphotransferase family protein, partial [Pirellulales bacterium]